MCNKKFQYSYYIKRLNNKEKELLVKMYINGMGIRGVARVLNTSATTIIRHIKSISAAIVPPVYKTGQTYEVDELRTFVGNKKNECWVAYALNRQTKRIENFVVGRRTKGNLGKLVSILLNRNPKAIYTDGLTMYRSLIPNIVHKTFARCTNKIERFNLTLRTHLKRLARKTICYSKSIQMLGFTINMYANY
jgi:IS1 family transposase